MVDLDSDPTKLIEVVEVGKQLLMTRGALTTFSIANDVAKYFAILPAMFVTAYPAMRALNVMRLGDAAERDPVGVIFNALIIIALIPLALARRRLPAARRERRACATTSDLRPGRHRRAVHRHQAHRHDPRRNAPHLSPEHGYVAHTQPRPPTSRDNTLRHLVTAALYTVVSVVAASASSIRW
jgi:hypothetical protein